jgi:hypothetical protein
VTGDHTGAPSEPTLPIILAPTPTTSTHTRIDVRTPPPPANRTRSDTFVVQPGTASPGLTYLIGVPRGAFEKWMKPVLSGPATRGDMELLAQYLITPPPSKSTPISAPVGNQFFDFNVSAVMDSFYRRLQRALFVPIQDDESFFLDAQDWQSKLGDSERVLLESVKRFILHTALYAARATPNDFAFERELPDGRLHESRLEKVDCLRDLVEDVVALAKFLKDSCETPPESELPSLKDFIRARVLELSTLAREGRRQPRQYFFKPNSERGTHEYSRKACCVILGLVDDYDQSPEFGLTAWSKRVLVFDNLQDLLSKGFGLSFKGQDKKELSGMMGSIVDLDANFIATGPFTFTKTNRVQEHLTLDRSGRIRIYTSKALASTAYMFQSHIIARYFPSQRLLRTELIVAPPEYPILDSKLPAPTPYYSCKPKLHDRNILQKVSISISKQYLYRNKFILMISKQYFTIPYTGEISLVSKISNSSALDYLSYNAK